MNRRRFIPLLGSAIVGASTLSFNIDKDKKFIADNFSIVPPKLNKGDLIGICAPAGASKSSSEAIDFKATLEKLGYRVKLGANLNSRNGYFSATDESRAKEFMDFIENAEVNAIFFLRGGWGCQRILPYLDFNAIANNPKIIMGFSDITSLLTAISIKTNLVTFHGPNGNSTWGEYSMNYFRQVLSEPKRVVFNDNAFKTYSKGSATGQIIGGNLSVLVGLIGTEYEPEWSNKILFLEDVKEEPYRIDRMLTQLDQAGVFNGINGIVLGEFRKCVPEEPEFSFTLDEVFNQHFEKLPIPVYAGARIGHIRDKYIVPVGCMVKMDADKGAFEMLNTAVH